MNSDLAHCATARIAASAEHVFGFLSDPIRLGSWALGCMNTAPTDEPGVYAGTSQFDGARGWLRIAAYPDLRLIDYWVGPKGALAHRISARVIRGADAGLAPGQCLVMLTAWRVSGMDDARWSRLCAAHEAEIWLIKCQIEITSASE